MAQNTRTWAEAVGLTQARAGASFAAGTELTNIGFLLNSAARTVYDESRWWERFLVVEPRTVERGYVAYTEDSYNVFGAGTADVNGLYVRNGDENSLPRYSIYDSDLAEQYKVRATSAAGTTWEIVNTITLEGAYTYTGAASTMPPETGWSNSVTTNYASTDGVDDKAINADTDLISGIRYLTGMIRSATTGTHYATISGAALTIEVTTANVWQAFVSTSVDFGIVQIVDVSVGWDGDTNYSEADWSEVKLRSADPFGPLEPETDPVDAHYKLDEQSSGSLDGVTASDSSGNGNDGTYVGCTGGSFELNSEALAPGPLVQALSEIGEYIGHWDGELWTCADSQRGQAYPDHNGIKIANCNHGDTVYVAYKKSFTDTYGDGENGTVSDIPSEWLEFMSYDAARAYAASQGNQDGYNPVAIRDVDRAMERALMKVSRQGINETIALYFRTNYGYDVSVN